MIQGRPLMAQYRKRSDILVMHGYHDTSFYGSISFMFLRVLPINRRTFLRRKKLRERRLFYLPHHWAVTKALKMDFSQLLIVFNIKKVRRFHINVHSAPFPGILSTCLLLVFQISCELIGATEAKSHRKTADWLTFYMALPQIQISRY